MDGLVRGGRTDWRGWVRLAGDRDGGVNGNGMREAMARRFAAHRRWMWRSYLLLCSAVVIRVTGGLATTVGMHAAWFDALASWACWIVPLTIFELRGSLRRTARLMTRSATSI